MEILAKNFAFVDEEIKIHGELRAALATPNVLRLDLRTMVPARLWAVPEESPRS